MAMNPGLCAINRQHDEKASAQRNNKKRLIVSPSNAEWDSTIGMGPRIESVILPRKKIGSTLGQMHTRWKFFKRERLHRGRTYLSVGKHICVFKLQEHPRTAAKQRRYSRLSMTREQER